MVYGDYADTGFLNWARSHVSEDGVIIDSGTNVGQFLPYFANIVSEGEILAFEPSSDCVQWVQECLDVNPDLPIELIPKGLGREEEELVLENTEGAHGLWGTLSRDQRIQEERVQVTALTDAVRSRKIPQVSLWKLDVEGHELEALKGADGLLAEKKIHALYVELRAENRSEDVTFLRNHGYSAYETTRNGKLKAVQEHPDSSADLLFLPQ
jgi:FkbM family methyltransferase